MRKSRFGLALVLGISGWAVVASCLSGSVFAIGEDEVQAINVARQFCELEFSGAQDVNRRMELMKISKEEEIKATAVMDGLSPYVVEWQSAPLDVVDSFAVGKANSTQNGEDVSVTYRIVATREAWGGQINRVEPRLETVRLHLIVDHQKWRVLDPGKPRISREFLSDSYRSMFELPASWYRGASKEQLLGLKGAIDNIILLDSLNPVRRNN